MEEKIRRPETGGRTFWEVWTIKKSDKGGRAESTVWDGGRFIEEGEGGRIAWADKCAYILPLRQWLGECPGVIKELTLRGVHCTATPLRGSFPSHHKLPTGH